MVCAKFEISLVLASLVWFLSYPSIISVSSASEQVDDSDKSTCSVSNFEGGDDIVASCHEHQIPRVPEDCQLVYAKIPANEEEGSSKQAQWGTFIMSPRKKGTPVRKHGDIVIQWIDPIPESLKNKNRESSGRILRKYTWKGQETGGHYEGKTSVESVVTGLGITARSTTIKTNSNILPFIPRVDEGSLTRFESPGAGAATRYHNYTWWFSKDLQAGDELVYSSEGKLAYVSPSLGHKTTDQNIIFENVRRPLSLEYLKMNGYCMDNMRPRKSRIKEAGRGAFATRDLLRNSVVAPVPVALVHRDELLRSNSRNQQQEHQLLLNYCFGHKSSSWLLFPSSPVVNLINHYNEPNVELRWSTASNFNHSINEVQPDSTILLELVASRPIKMGEEIYLDYGRGWEDSWWKHVREIWKPNNKHYAPSFVMDDAVKIIRTEQEQKTHPYPENLFTSCFYRYSDRSEEERGEAKSNQNKDSITSFRWRLTKGLYDLKNLRPCRILKRTEDKSGQSNYAARMLNWPGLNDNEIIPRDELHIVTHIPRAAIRFSDKAETTDQHLKNAFRHEIGLPEHFLPPAWKI